jgi:DNA-binding transcriptional regulator YhcF (GntR family)
MLLKIDRVSSRPLYQQIIDGIKALVDQGVIGFDQKLPSTRILARKLGVNRSTVVRAYEELQAFGYLKSASGSYSIIQKRRKEVEYDPERKCLLECARFSTPQARKLHEIFLRYSPEGLINRKSEGQAINISQLDLDPRLYPMKEFRRCVN